MATGWPYSSYGSKQMGANNNGLESMEKKAKLGITVNNRWYDEI